MAWIAGLIAVGGSLLSDSMQDDPPNVAGMSPAEQELMGLQSSLLRDMQDSMHAGQDLNRMLMPILLEESGFNVTRAEKNVVNPGWTRARERYDKIHSLVMNNQQYFARDQNGNLRLSAKGRGDDGGNSIVNNLKDAFNISSGFKFTPDAAIADLKKITGDKGGRDALQAMVDEFNKSHAALSTVDHFSHRRGDITGIERAPLDEAGQLRENIQLELLHRQDAALRGELPVNPALLSSLDEQEGALRESLLSNLGTGYETSSPGIEALAKFGEKKQNILEAARRDDMGGAQQLAIQLGSFMNGMEADRMNVARSAVGSEYAAGQAYGSGAGAFSSPLSYMQQNRALQAGLFTNNNYPGAMQSMLTQGSSAAAQYSLAQLFSV